MDKTSSAIRMTRDTFVLTDIIMQITFVVRRWQSVLKLHFGHWRKCVNMCFWFIRSIKILQINIFDHIYTNILQTQCWHKAVHVHWFSTFPLRPNKTICGTPPQFYNIYQRIINILNPWPFLRAGLRVVSPGWTVRCIQSVLKWSNTASNNLAS